MVLAFYDLCAVLTPCGPLRALVRFFPHPPRHSSSAPLRPCARPLASFLTLRDPCQIELAQTRRDPLPALLYEANLGDGTRSGRRQFPTALTGGRRGDTADARDRSGCSGQGAGTGTAAAAAVPGGAQPTMELQSVHPGEMGSSAAAAPAPAPGRLSGSDDHAGAASGSADGAWSSDVEEEEEGGGEWTAEESDGEAGAAGGGRGMAHRGRGGEEDMEFQYMEEEDTEGADGVAALRGSPSLPPLPPRLTQLPRCRRVHQARSRRLYLLLPPCVQGSPLQLLHRSNLFHCDPHGAPSPPRLAPAARRSPPLPAPHRAS